MRTRDLDTSLRWIWRGGALAALLIGWIFILWHNNMHITPPVVFVCLGYFAGVAAVYTLFKTGSSAVAATDEDHVDTVGWGLAGGARAELELEKKTLLKAIKEAEFDHLMGKLSKRDVDEMIRVYRLRAIEVIKLLEENKGTSVRDQIELEVRARLQVESVRHKMERVHADLAQRKNQKKAAEAAQKAAREAAAKGLPAEMVRAVAAEAARKTDDEDDAAETADAAVEASVATADAATEKANAAVEKSVAKTDVAAAKADAENAVNDAKVDDADSEKADVVKDAKADANGQDKTATTKSDDATPATSDGAGASDAKEATS
jgi:DNA polymerase III gamma/tau subunit